MKPTVLIGLGGIGSKSVDTIYDMMNQEQRALTATVVLDTDIGDLKKLENVDIKIQTSPDVKVGNYVHRHEEIKAWFPTGFKKIDELMLTDGAGQIRALSRLSFYSAIERGEISKLDKAVEKLSLINDSVYKGDVNVVIVGSIAGGTGSGSFLQMGMYMRKYFNEKNPNASIFIQGVFLLPDAILKTGKIVESEWANLRFNSYAALKELNAILSPSVMENMNIELEYHPDVTNSRITYENRPYDNILFFDYENSNNQHLNTFGEYMELLAETIYFAYISPISSEYQSRFVNEIRAFIKNKQESFYSASSVNKLIYPYADIIDFLSLEWISDEINRSWLQFDKDYDDLISEYKSNQSKGINSPKPKKDEIYIDSIDRLENVEKSPFFAMIFKQTRLWDEEKGEVLGTKDEKFVNAINTFIEKTLELDNNLQEYSENCKLRGNHLENVENAVKNISRYENNRIDFEKNIDKIIQKHKNMLVKEMVTKDCENDNLAIDHEYNINRWLMEDRDAMHPVASRYFLYKVRDILRGEIDTFNKDLGDLKIGLEDYEATYNILGPRDQGDKNNHLETSAEVVRLIAKRSVVDKFKDMFSENGDDYDFSAFIGKFQDQYSGYVENLEQILAFKLKKAVYEKVLSQIEQMIENWEGLFSMLGKDLLEDIAKDRETLIAKHEQKGKDIYLFATESLKRSLWEDVEHEVKAQGDDSNLAKEINLSQYRLFCQQQDPAVTKKGLQSKQNYKKILLDSYRNALTNKIGDRLDLDLIDAVSMESRLSSEETPSLKEYIEKLKNKNHPWIHTPTSEMIFTHFWGAHAKTVFEEHKLPGNITEDPLFSKNELVHLVMYHNLSIEDFKKFARTETYTGSVNEGSYFIAYHDLMRKIKDEPLKYVTPHIDKRWGAPTFMPDLNNSVSEAQEELIDQAFILGLIQQNIFKEEKNGRTWFMVKRPKKIQPIEIHSEPVTDGRYLSLLEGLQYNPVIVDEIIEHFNTMQENNLKVARWDMANDLFLKQVAQSTLLEDLVSAYKYETRSEKQVETILELIEQYGELITAYIAKPVKDKYAAEMKANEMKEKLFNALPFEQLGMAESRTDRENIALRFGISEV